MNDRMWLTNWGVMLIVGILLLMFALARMPEAFTCPNYGEVPARVDGQYECVVWGQP